MSITAHVQRISQPIGDFYVGALSVREILNMSSFDFRRMTFTSGYVDFLGIQRRVDPTRAKKIEKYARTAEACFPTSIVLSIDERCAKLVETENFGFHKLVVNEYVDADDSTLNIPLVKAASIVDGQHRLSGLRDAGVYEMELPVTIFVGATVAMEASIFSIVNLAQTKVNKSLVYDLFSLSEKRSPERSCHQITVSLDRMDESPFKGKIKRLGAKTLGREDETLSQATIVKGLLPYLTSDAMADRDIGHRFGFWDPPTGGEARRRVFRHFFVANQDEKILAILINYFNAIASKWDVAWESTDEGVMIQRTNGYLGFMRFLKPAYLELRDAGMEVPSVEDFKKLLEPVGLKDGEFTTRNFPPGSSGAKRLFDRLTNDTGLSG